MNRNIPLSQQFYECGLKHADLHAAASLLEETKSTVQAQLALRHTAQGVSVSKSELMAKADPLMEQHINNMVEARKAANKAKVEMEFLRIKHWENQSEQATERLQARI